MRNEIVKRVLDEAKYILKTKKTIREIALENKISKSKLGKEPWNKGLKRKVVV